MPDPADARDTRDRRDPRDPRDTPGLTTDAPRLLRIQEVASELGLTPRSIRYYEEVGLLRPAARSEGSYRLYDADDLDRLRFIKGLRDDAGFSLAEIGALLEDEAARERNRARYRATDDPGERHDILIEAIARRDRQIASLRAKADRLAEMIADAEARRAHLATHLEQLDRVEPAERVDGATQARA